ENRPHTPGMGRKTRGQGSKMLAKTFGQRLRKLREERSLSQRELALGVGTETSQVSRYERGVVMPNAETLIDMARFLRVGAGFLPTGEDAGTPEELPIHDLSLLERFRDLEKLTRRDRETVIAVIDAILSSREYEEIGAKRARRTA